MTQLFDTTTYEDLAEAGEAEAPVRRLRSVPASIEPAESSTSTQWRLDDQTIEVGRRGIQAAREALQAAARTSKTPTRKAA